MQGVASTGDDLQVYTAAATEPTCCSQVGASKRCHQECRGCTCSAAPKANLTVTVQACDAQQHNSFPWLAVGLQSPAARQQAPLATGAACPADVQHCPAGAQPLLPCAAAHGLTKLAAHPAPNPSARSNLFSEW